MFVFNFNYFLLILPFTQANRPQLGLNSAARACCHQISHTSSHQFPSLSSPNLLNKKDKRKIKLFHSHKRHSSPPIHMRSLLSSFSHTHHFTRSYSLVIFKNLMQVIYVSFVYKSQRDFFMIFTTRVERSFLWNTPAIFPSLLNTFVYGSFSWGVIFLPYSLVLPGQNYSHMPHLAEYIILYNNLVALSHSHFVIAYRHIINF